MSNLDLSTLIRSPHVARPDQDNRPVIWGGEFGAGRLDEFLKIWEDAKLDLPWRIWEWASDITLEHKTLNPPTGPTWRQSRWLERGRLFGMGGDLSLRRDENRFLWRFVGLNQTQLPDGLRWEEEAHLQGEQHDFLAADYWRAYPDRALRSRPCHVLLWGQEYKDATDHPTGIWFEDRVSGVKQPLVYPGLSDKSTHGRVQLRYDEYLHGDSVEAVWWLKLEGWEQHAKEEKHER